MGNQAWAAPARQTRRLGCRRQPHVTPTRQPTACSGLRLMGDHGRVRGEKRTADRLTSGVAVASLVAGAVLMVAGLLLQTHTETGPASIVWTLAGLDLALGCWLWWAVRLDDEDGSTGWNEARDADRRARTDGADHVPVPRTVALWRRAGHDPVGHGLAEYDAAARGPAADVPGGHHRVGHHRDGPSPAPGTPARWSRFDEADVDTGIIRMGGAPAEDPPDGDAPDDGGTVVGLEQFFDTIDITTIHVDLLKGHSTYGPASLPDVPVEPDTLVPLEGIVLPDGRARWSVSSSAVSGRPPTNGHPRRALASEAETASTPPRPRRAARDDLTGPGDI